MLWVDKYRPKALDKVIVHEDVAQNLKKLVITFPLNPFSLYVCSQYFKSWVLMLIHYFMYLQVTEQDCPHLLFYGPPGSGKKTLIMALLRQMFGASVEKVSLCKFPFLFIYYKI